MKKCLALLIILSWLSVPTTAISGSSPSPTSWTGNINGFLGMKYLDEYDWEPVEEQAEFGVMLDFKQESWPVSIAIDYLLSSDNVTGLYYDPGYGTIPVTFEGETSELCLGVRKVWDYIPTVRPFFGGGVALIRAQVKAITWDWRDSADDDAVGFWIGGGVYWTLGEHFNIGFDVRWSKAEVTIDGLDFEAGGTHAGLLLGYHW
jgi:opacity protein-like surface antigen